MIIGGVFPTAYGWRALSTGHDRRVMRTGTTHTRAHGPRADRRALLATCSVARAEKSSHVNLPNRDELLLRIVFALPKASSTGDALSMYCSTSLTRSAPPSRTAWASTFVCGLREHISEGRRSSWPRGTAQ